MASPGLRGFILVVPSRGCLPPRIVSGNLSGNGKTRPVPESLLDASFIDKTRGLCEFDDPLKKTELALFTQRKDAVQEREGNRVPVWGPFESINNKQRKL